MARRNATSRTFPLTHEEYSRLVAIAAIERRTMTQQLVHVVDRYIAGLDKETREAFDAELAQRSNAA